jgi:hypothetical protein
LLLPRISWWSAKEEEEEEEEEDKVLEDRLDEFALI